MPHPKALLIAFGLEAGTKFGPYRLKQAKSTHNVIKQFQEYTYDLTLQFVLESKAQKRDTLLPLLLEALKQVPRERVVSSYFGNPYKTVLVDEPRVSQKFMDLSSVWVEWHAQADRMH